MNEHENAVREWEAVQRLYRPFGWVLVGCWTVLLICGAIIFMQL